MLIIVCSCLTSIHLAGEDFIGGVQNVTFPSVSEADFDNVSIACTEFVILEDKLAFEEVENFSVSLLPLEISEEFLAEFGENTSATVEIRDNDCKFLSLLVCLSLFLSLSLSLSIPHNTPADFLQLLFHSGDPNL